MAIKIGQEFERTSKATRFKDDVMTKAQMLAGTDDNYSDGYLVVEKDSHDLYIYDVNATPSQETGKFVKKGPEGTPTLSEVLVAGNDFGTKTIQGTRTSAETGYTLNQNTSITASLYNNHRMHTPEEGLADRWNVDIGADHIQFNTNKGKTLKSILRIDTEDIENPVVTMSENMKTAWKTTLDINGGGSDIQVTTLPTASATEEGNIYQYVGQTDSNYTNGYFYQCVEVTPATDPKTYEWVQKNVQSDGVPDGGTTGQALVKKSDTDGDVEWKTVQDELVSGTNIKTINGNNILGEGDVVIRSGVGDEYDLTAMPSYNEVVADIANHNLRYIGGNWQVRSANKEASTVEINGIYANQKRTYYFEESDADAPLPEPYTFSDGYTSDATMSVYNGSPYNGVSFSYGGGGYAQYELTDNTITFKHKHPKIDTPVEKTYNIGVNFEVGVEKPYGTWTEDGVTYQTYTKTIFIPALSSTAGVTNYPHGITGIKQIIGVFGFGTQGFVLNSPRQTITDNIAIYQVQKGGNIAIEIGKDRSNMGAYITLIYAKNN